MQRTTKTLQTTIALTLLVALQAGCAINGTAQKQEATPASHATPAAPSFPSVLSGKVLETMDAGGYTYINLDQNGDKVWVAVPTAPVKVGQEIKVQDGAQMRSFSSKSLNRTFESIIFSGGVISDDAPAAANDPHGSGAPAGHGAAAPHGAPAAPASKMKREPAHDLMTSGKVTEVLDAGKYVYICLESDGKKGWAAIPATDVKVGEEVEVEEGTPMGAFTSKNLNRIFDNIVFSSGIARKK